MNWKVVFTDGEKKSFFDCSLKEVYDLLSEEEKELYQNWQDAKTNKNFALADEIRTKLIEKGIL